MKHLTRLSLRLAVAGMVPAACAHPTPAPTA